MKKLLTLLLLSPLAFAEDCTSKSTIDEMLECIDKAPSQEDIQAKKEQDLINIRAERIAEEERLESCSDIIYKDKREACLLPSYTQEYKDKQMAERIAKSKPEKKETSFLGKLAGAMLEGVVEGVVQASVNEALDLNCDEVVEVSSKTKQVIPGSPQYGSKTKTTVKTKRCP